MLSNNSESKNEHQNYSTTYTPIHTYTQTHKK